MRIRKAALVACVVALTGAAASAQDDLRVRAFVEPRSPVGDEQTVRLVIEVTGSGATEARLDRLPPLVNLKVVAGPSTSQSTSFRSIGTRTSLTVSKQIVYTLLPGEPGAAEIPALEVRVGSETRRTEPIRLEVVETRTGAGAPAPPDRGAPGSAPERDAVPVFVEAKLGAREAWVGEPVTLDVTLYSGERIGNFTWVDTPAFSNFWVESLEVDPSDEAYRTTVRGRTYVAYPLERKVLVPTTPGEFTIAPYAAQFQVRRSRGDLFDLFSMDRHVTVSRKTEPLDLRVRSLPSEGRPADFSGAVGSFRMEVSLDRGEARVNDALALRATVRGEGFLQSASEPRLEDSPNVKVFDSKVVESVTRQDGELRARKTWEWILVPLSPGEVPVPTVTFDFFDPEEGAYRRVRGEPGTLVVRRGEDGESVGPSEVRAQRRDIAFIKPLRGRLSERHPGVHRRGWFLALLGLPFLVVPATIVLGRQRMRYLRDHGLARARRARGRARRSLRATRRRVSNLDAAAFHEEIARALVEYVADRFDRSASGLTYDQADDLLGSRRVDPELRQRFRKCLERCDFARYVPSAAQAEEKTQALREAIDLVERLEKATS